MRSTRDSKVSTTETKEIKILLVDDHPYIHEGLHGALALYEDLVVCGEATTANDALRAVEKLKPDIVVSDISLGDKSGLELIREMRLYHPSIPVVVLSMHDEMIYGARALQAGAKAYVMKKEKVVKLVEAIRRVLAGHIYLSEDLSTFLFSDISQTKEKRIERPGIHLLTDREFEVFQLIGEGKKPMEIAAALCISVKTVNTHRSNIREKLGCESFSDLLIYAVRWIESES